jgi:hypothetical protein
MSRQALPFSLIKAQHKEALELETATTLLHGAYIQIQM